VGKDWIHESKHDGYRLIFERNGKRVRLFTRNGHEWTDRYPLIEEAAAQSRNFFRQTARLCCSASTASRTSTGCTRESTMMR
jgi:hypothetical protein